MTSPEDVKGFNLKNHQKFKKMAKIIQILQWIF